MNQYVLLLSESIGREMPFGCSFARPSELDHITVLTNETFYVKLDFRLDLRLDSGHKA
jgi:hypothetical protein